VILASARTARSPAAIRGHRVLEGFRIRSISQSDRAVVMTRKEFELAYPDVRCATIRLLGNEHDETS
jgi:hypothetical protein